MGISFFSSIRFSQEYLEEMSKRGASTVLENMVERVDDFCSSLGCFSKRVQIITVEKCGLVFKSSYERLVIDPEESDLNLIIRTLAIILIIPMIVLLFIKLILRFVLFCKYGFTAIERIEVKPSNPTVPAGISFLSSVTFSPTYLKEMSDMGRSTILEKAIERIDALCTNIGCLAKHVHVITAKKDRLVFETSPSEFAIDESEPKLLRFIKAIAIILIIPIILLLVVKFVLRLALFCKYGTQGLEHIEVEQPKPTIPEAIKQPIKPIVKPAPTPPIIRRSPLSDSEIESRYLTPRVTQDNRDLMCEIFRLLLYGCDRDKLEQMQIRTCGEVGIHKRFSFYTQKGNMQRFTFTYVPGTYVPPGGVIGMPIHEGVFRSVDEATFKFYADRCLNSLMAQIDLASMRQRGVDAIRKRMRELNVEALSEVQFVSLRKKLVCERNLPIVAIASLEEVPCYHNGALVGHAGIIVEEML
ncbi:hypothetical protein SBV45_03915 [Chlamydia crocodili]|uniref:hypothetical protein n=1 Tax=Chlamydia TaxID=810 RepID=UPI0035D40E02